MKRSHQSRSRFWLLAALLILAWIASIFYNRDSIARIRRTPERSYELWMAALKGFEGPVYYIGSEGDFSYFRAGKYFSTYYKARTSKIRLPQTFDLGKGTPYRVTHEMVVRY